MPYKSVLGTSGNIPAAKQSQAQAISSRFVPGQYAQVNAAIKARTVNPSSIKDIKTLNKALQANQINKAQWMNRYKEIVPQVKPENKFSRKNVTSSLGDALNRVLVKPTVSATKAVVRPAADLASGNAGKAVNDAAQLGRNLGVQQTIEGAARIAPNAAIIGANLVQKARGKEPVNKKKGFEKTQVGHLAKTSGATGSNKQLAIDAALTGSLFFGGAEAAAVKNAAKKGIAKVTGETAAKKTLTNARVANVLAKTEQTGKVGKSTVAEANITRIPVVNPTESKLAQKNVGNVAVDNADRTSIPVKGTSTSVTGKVTKAPDANYVKQSNQLSKAYEKEVAQLKNVPSPRAQQVLQARIDTKYAKLQFDLDKKAGQTNVSFTGKPIKETGPKSAFTKELANAPQTPFGGAGKAQTTKATKTPVQTPKTTPAASTSVKPTVTTTKPTESVTKTVTTGAPKVSGSAIRTEQKAVEAGLESEFKDKATFNQVSHKEQAAKAVKLADEDEAKALDIALGRKAGDNASHEAAVYHAVANKELAKAKKTGDFSRVQELARSPRHAAVSEAAQKLGAEGYNVNPNDPIQLMADVVKTREKALGKKAATTVDKAAETISKEVKAATPKIPAKTWHDFVESIKC